MTTQTRDANDILMGGGGAPRARFDRPGTTFAGRITHISDPYQEREYDPNNPGGGAPKFYPKSGDPIMTFNIDLATDQRDRDVDNDDGTRRVYMDGARIKNAVRSAVREAGARGLEHGGHLSITYTHDDVEGDHRSGKNWQVVYTSAANAALMGGPGQAAETQPVPVQQAPQQAAPTAAPQAAGLTRPPSVPEPVWSQLTPEQQAATVAAVPPY